MASSPSSSSLQHVMIGSEREFNQKCKSELAQQRVIKDSSFVISANKFATRVISLLFSITILFLIQIFRTN